jgi:hypothetical protein
MTLHAAVSGLLVRAAGRAALIAIAALAATG